MRKLNVSLLVLVKDKINHQLDIFTRIILFKKYLSTAKFALKLFNT
jgi:hypothetical protein